jgi:hypothetical protein
MSEENKYPPLAEQGKNLLRSIGRSIEYFLEEDEKKAISVTPKVFEERITICKSCEYCDISQKRCRKCGCFLPAKARMVAESCPLEKWGVDKTKKND